MNILSPEFRHVDDRRSLTQLLTADIKQINVYKAKKGAELGDHYHTQTIEYFHIVRGSIRYNDEKTFDRGTTFAVFPGERHKLKCLSNVIMLTFLTKPFNQEAPDLHV